MKTYLLQALTIGLAAACTPTTDHFGKDTDNYEEGEDPGYPYGVAQQQAPTVYECFIVYMQEGTWQSKLDFMRAARNTDDEIVRCFVDKQSKLAAAKKNVERTRMLPRAAQDQFHRRRKARYRSRYDKCEQPQTSAAALGERGDAQQKADEQLRALKRKLKKAKAAYVRATLALYEHAQQQVETP